MATEERQYDLIVYGATGYTGKLCAEHITTSLPTDLKWAIAGRNWAKLAEVTERLKAINPSRDPPSIEVADLKKEELEAISKKARLVITTVGPYARYGEPMLAACVETGTHYLDCTGEVPWLYDMIKKYDAKAKAKGTIIIPQCGIDSVPADVTALTLSHHLRTKHSVPTGEVINCVYHIDANASGGTLSSVMTLFELFTPVQLGERMKPYAISPVKPSAKVQAASRSFLSKLIGIRQQKPFGTLTQWFMGAVDVSIVNRSWGLFQQKGDEMAYGENFHFSEWMRARNPLTGIFIHLGLVIGPLFLLFSPIRWLLKKFIYAPGSGPDLNVAAHDIIHYRGLATADSPEKQKAQSSFEYHGSMYLLTGVTLAEAGMIILRGNEGKKHLASFGGGLLTPACLGLEYVERLKQAGVKLQVSDVQE